MNQNTKELTVGRSALDTMLTNNRGELMQIATPEICRNYDTWKMRAVAEISGRDELAPVLNTDEGRASLFKGLCKASTFGLQVGGNFPHCYFVPKSGKAVLVITADGYAFACVHGPGAVLKSVPEIKKVYEKDTFSVDASAGKVAHTFNPFGERGKLLGYYTELEYLDGHRECPFVTFDKVKHISEAYSTKMYGDKPAPAWKKSEEDMFDKIAAKQLLKKPAKESEGLSMLIENADTSECEDTQPATQPDVAERMAVKVEDATAKIKRSEERRVG